jgi:hypothetical protein
MLREENHLRALRDLYQDFISEASAPTERTSAIELGVLSTRLDCSN